MLTREMALLPPNLAVGPACIKDPWLQDAVSKYKTVVMVEAERRRLVAEKVPDAVAKFREITRAAGISALYSHDTVSEMMVRFTKDFQTFMDTHIYRRSEFICAVINGELKRETALATTCLIVRILFHVETILVSLLTDNRVFLDWWKYVGAKVSLIDEAVQQVFTTDGLLYAPERMLRLWIHVFKVPPAIKGLVHGLVEQADTFVVKDMRVQMLLSLAEASDRPVLRAWFTADQPKIEAVVRRLIRAGCRRAGFLALWLSWHADVAAETAVEFVSVSTALLIHSGEDVMTFVVNRINLVPKTPTDPYGVYRIQLIGAVMLAMWENAAILSKTFAWNKVIDTVNRLWVRKSRHVRVFLFQFSLGEARFRSEFDNQEGLPLVLNWLKQPFRPSRIHDMVNVRFKLRVSISRENFGWM